jgi:hypothetical protein
MYLYRFVIFAVMVLVYKNFKSFFGYVNQLTPIVTGAINAASEKAKAS